MVISAILPTYNLIIYPRQYRTVDVAHVTIFIIQRRNFFIFVLEIC